MKVIMKRMAVMSVALVLFCVGTLAQTEKSTKSVTYNSSGVTITPTTQVELAPGQTAYLTIVPQPGYYNVKIYYGIHDSSYEVGQLIVGNNFTAQFFGTLFEGGILEIRANNDANIRDTEYLSVEAEMIPEELWKMVGVRSRTAITITIVSSSSGNN